MGTYNKLTPIGPDKGGGRYQWLFRCDCGNVATAYFYTVSYGKKTSCGCETTLRRSSSLRKHGMTKTRFFTIWAGMMQRCHNKRAASYRHYGAKGIRVCKRWHSFQNFLRDMYDTYRDDLSIDRIDNTKGYSKSNCRWTTPEQQSRNRANVKLISEKPLSLVSTELGGSPSLVRVRLKNGWKLEDAISTPVIASRRNKKARRHTCDKSKDQSSD